MIEGHTPLLERHRLALNAGEQLGRGYRLLRRAAETFSSSPGWTVASFGGELQAGLFRRRLLLLWLWLLLRPVLFFEENGSDFQGLHLLFQNCQLSFFFS